MSLTPTAGTQVGNGSFVEFFGDVLVGGRIVNNNSNSGKTGGEVEAFEGFFNDVVDGSYYVQDATNRVITIWINISGKVANTQTNSANTGIIAIPNNPNDNVYIPPVSSDYIDDQGAVNFINFMMNIQSNSGATTTGGLAYLSQGEDAGIIYFSPSYTYTEGDPLVIQGTLSYPY
jgi:hypothetical protein